MSPAVAVSKHQTNSKNQRRSSKIHLQTRLRSEAHSRAAGYEFKNLLSKNMPASPDDMVLNKFAKRVNRRRADLQIHPTHNLTRNTARMFKPIEVRVRWEGRFQHVTSFQARNSKHLRHRLHTRSFVRHDPSGRCSISRQRMQACDGQRSMPCSLCPRQVYLVKRWLWQEDRLDAFTVINWREPNRGNSAESV